MATYNIHRGVGGDRLRDPARITAVIRSLAAGVVGLQEVDSAPVGSGSFQMDYLAGATGYTPIPGPTVRGTDGDFGNVLLSAHPVRAVRHLDLTVEDLEPREAIDADLEVAGRRLRVLNTHLGLRARERREQAERLARTVAAGPAGPVVLLGDINEWLPWSRTLRRLRAIFGPAPAPATFRAGLPVLALDRIYARPAGALREVRTVRNGPARTASDHLPVVGRVVLAG